MDRRPLPRRRHAPARRPLKRHETHLHLRPRTNRPRPNPIRPETFSGSRERTRKKSSLPSRSLYAPEASMNVRIVILSEAKDLLSALRAGTLLQTASSRTRVLYPTRGGTSRRTSLHALDKTQHSNKTRNCHPERSEGPAPSGRCTNTEPRPRKTPSPTRGGNLRATY